MKLEHVMTSDELTTARVSQAYFGRVIGVSKMRVTQLIKSGLLIADSSGVMLIESLRRWHDYQASGETLSVFVRRYSAD